MCGGGGCGGGSLLQKGHEFTAICFCRDSDGFFFIDTLSGGSGLPLASVAVVTIGIGFHTRQKIDNCLLDAGSWLTFPRLLRCGAL